MIAAECGDFEMVQLLLQHHPPPPLNAHDEYGSTALLLAIKNNKLDIASLLLDAGADVTLA
jgi:ankyrin repeat protein